MAKFSKKDIPKLNIAMLHSQFGFEDGVSIVMKQIEQVLTRNMNVPREHIFYLVGKAKHGVQNLTQRQILWDAHPTNKLTIKNYSKGFGGEKSERIESAIKYAKDEIARFMQDKQIDVLIAHNTSHPYNFITSVALSRYYRDAIEQEQKTPKYILWWHDSHAERDIYKNPTPDVAEYLIEGIPGPYVEYTIFINSLQLKTADNYLLQLDERSPGHYKAVQTNHDIIYNTTDTFINTYDDLEHNEKLIHTQTFLEDFGVLELLKKHNIKLDETCFILQHTRVVQRKRIDFALQYAYALLAKLKEQKKAKALYFFISGYSDHAENTKANLKRLHTKLQKETGINTLFLVFSEDIRLKKQTRIVFEEFPKIFAQLGGVSTYFSEIEGFGNNLLEVLASGLIPIVYTYPVFKADIAKFKFKAIVLDKFEITDNELQETIDVLSSAHKRKIWVNKNLQILKDKLPHKIMQRKLTRAIIRKREHR